MDDANGPVAQADGAAEESLPDLLRGHTLALITTDENGRINIRVDIPPDSRVDLVGDIVVFNWLVGKLNRFLGSIQETACQAILEKQQKERN